MYNGGMRLHLFRLGWVGGTSLILWAFAVAPAPMPDIILGGFFCALAGWAVTMAIGVEEAQDAKLCRAERVLVMRSSGLLQEPATLSFAEQTPAGRLSHAHSTASSR